MNRARLIQLVKIGQKKMGWDDSTYRAWLAKHTGKSSCKNCSEAELSLAADLLRDLGALTKSAAVAIPGGSGPDRPTQAQWRLVVKLSKDCGLTGALDDPGLITLCARVAKIDNPRFLDKRGVQSLINALEGWATSKKRHKSAAPKEAKPENPEIGP